MAVITEATNPGVPRCEYCKQPLLNQAAIRALAASKAAIAKKISDAASAKAVELAAEKIEDMRGKLEKLVEGKVELKYRGRLRDLTRTVEKAVRERDDMQRKLQQSTASDQGALHEEDVVRLLKEAFPEDKIEHRGKGGDVLHEVFYRAGSERTSAGLIVYECKDTIHWNSAFIDEVKAAAEQHRTPHAMIVTKAFPAKCKDLVTREDVVIVHPDRVVELVRVLRTGICEIHRAGLTAQGQAEKTLALYRYLTSEDFRQRFDAIMEIDRRLKSDLGDERKKHERLWERREACYNEVAQNAAAIDARIRGVIEKETTATHSKVVQLAAS